MSNRHLSRFCLSLIGALLLVPGGAAAAEIELEKVASGVYVVLQPAETRINDANNVVIVTERDVIVIDTATDPARAEAVMAAIAELTDKRIRYLINTHWHLDHTQGNQAYMDALPDLVIVGHETLKVTVPGRGAEQRREEIEAYREAVPRVEGWIERREDGEGNALTDEQVADFEGRLERGRSHLAMLESIRPVPPTTTVGTSLTLERESGDVRVMAFRGHTEGDLVVYLPRQRMLVAGDLVDEMPFAGHGDPYDWIESLDTLAEVDFETLVPGHGPVMTGRGQVARVRGFLSGVIGAVETEMEEGRCPEDIASRIDPAPYRELMAPADDLAERAFDFFLGAIVERTCALAAAEG